MCDVGVETIQTDNYLQYVNIICLSIIVIIVTTNTTVT